MLEVASIPVPQAFRPLLCREGGSTAFHDAGRPGAPIEDIYTAMLFRAGFVLTSRSMLPSELLHAVSGLAAERLCNLQKRLGLC